MNLTEGHLRASYEVYMSHGNSSSATIFSVLRRHLENGPGADHVVGCAFGPGIAVEMMMFRRNQGSQSGTEYSGTSSPQETLVAEDVD